MPRSSPMEPKYATSWSLMRLRALRGGLAAQGQAMTPSEQHQLGTRLNRLKDCTKPMRAGPSSTSRKQVRLRETGQLTPPARNKAVYRLLLSASGNKASPRKFLPRVLAQSSHRWAIVKSATRDPGSVCFCVASLKHSAALGKLTSATPDGSLAHSRSPADRAGCPSLVPGRPSLPAVGHARLLFPVGPHVEALAAAFAALGPSLLM